MLAVAAMAGLMGCSVVWGFEDGQPLGTGPGGAGGSAGSDVNGGGGCGGLEVIVLRDVEVGGNATNVVDDCTIDEAEPNTTSGSLAVLRAYREGSGTQSVVLLRFDTAGIGSGASIVAAYLQLRIAPGSGSGLMSLGELAAYPVLQSWTEQDASWTIREQTTAWSAPGAGPTTSRSEEPCGIIANELIPEDGTATMELDTAVVQGWLSDAAANFGLALVATGDDATFHSSESTSVDSRPSLIVTYDRCP